MENNYKHQKMKIEIKREGYTIEETKTSVVLSHPQMKFKQVFKNLKSAHKWATKTE